MAFFLLLSLALCSVASPLVKRQAPAGVPQYVVDYAPIVYLYSGEKYLPSDIGAQLTNTHPDLNFTAITDGPKPLTLNNLNELNNVKGGNDGANIYLTSNENVATNPAYLNGVLPDSKGSTAPAISCAVIVVDRGNNSVDAFFMYFYAFNYGGSYLGYVIGDHVGDWEHNMVRFQNGVPQAVWYSQHSNGEAFTYNATEKYNNGVRPISYSANGTHANYAITGKHDHTIPDVNLPDGLIVDYTDKGPLWDPTLSAYYYAYDESTEKFTAYNDSTPVNWLYFLGAWGDEQYPTSNPDQDCPIPAITELCKYTSGPTGPITKDLNRTEVCPDNGIPCIIRPVLTP